MTKIIHGSDVCKKNLKVNLSRLKTNYNQRSHTAGCLKTPPKERIQRPHIPVREIPSLACNDETCTDELPCCGFLYVRDQNNNDAQKTALYTYPVTPGRKSPTLPLRKIPNPHIYKNGSSFLSDSACIDENRSFYSDGSVSDSSDEIEFVEQPSTPLGCGQERCTSCSGSSCHSNMKTRPCQQKKWVSYIQARKVFGVRRQLLHGNKLVKRTTLFSSCDGKNKLQFNNKNRSNPDSDLEEILRKYKLKKKLVITLRPVRRRETNAAPLLPKRKQEVSRQENPVSVGSGERASTKRRQGDGAANTAHEFLGLKEPQMTIDEVAADASGATPKINENPNSTEDCGTEGVDKSYEKNPAGKEVQEDGENKTDDALKRPFPTEQNGLQAVVCTNGQKKEKMMSPLPYRNQIEELKAKLKVIHRKQAKEGAETCSRRRTGGLDSPDSTGGSDRKLSLTLRPLTPSNRQRTAAEISSAADISSAAVSCNKRSTEIVSVDIPVVHTKLKTGSLVVPTAADGDGDDDGGIGEDDDDDDDDDVIVESIKTPRGLNRGQITSCMSGMLTSHNSQR